MALKMKHFVGFGSIGWGHIVSGSPIVEASVFTAEVYTTMEIINSILSSGVTVFSAVV